ncbi:HalOD1 output domain-containing protein [Halobacterium wangiae]|uniref:HalOD1 output domain-containing protein n=1 Tax=Halobacterium wangiae TaxID=2902623 RepID=UPI001E44C653|nr:HalOD1 output domain-containing protein [Halobacterium wangiae]
MLSTHTTDVRPEFDPETGVYEVRHEHDSPWAVSTTLVLALSSLTDDGPLEMRPLYYTVDPAVLDDHVGGQNADGTLSFEFHGHHVTVRDDGLLTLSPLRDCNDSPQGVNA